MKTIDKTLDKFQDAASKNKTKSARLKELADLKSLMSRPEFRRFVYRFLTRAHCFKSIFNEPSIMAHNAGWQDSGFFVMEEVSQASSAAYFLMLKESASAAELAAMEVLEEAQTLRAEAESRGELTDE